MNLCDIYIEKIIAVKTYDKYVIAILDTDCWGCKKKRRKSVLLKRTMGESEKRREIPWLG